MLDAAFLKTLQYERRATLDEVKADLADLVAFDRKENQYLTLWGRLAGGSGAAVAAGLGFAVCCGVTSIGWPMVGAAAIPLLVSVYFYVRHSFRVLDARRYELAIALVRHVGRDLEPGRPFELSIDFRKTQSTPFEIERHTAGVLTFIKYKQPWFKARGRLVDGTKFEVEVEQRIDRKETPKRKSTRIRENFQERLRVTLAGRPEKRPSLKLAPQLVAASLARRTTVRSVRIIDGALQTTIVTSKRRRDTVRGTPLNPDAEKQLVTPDLLLSVFVSCFRAWRMVRRPLPT